MRSKKPYRANLSVWKARAFRKLGNYCACCEEDRPEFLTMDHINGGGRAHRTQFTPLQFYKWIATDPKAAETIQVLCMNCNWGKRYKAECTHTKDRQKVCDRDMVEALEEQIKDLEAERDMLQIRLSQHSLPSLIAPEGFVYKRHIARLDWNEFERSLAPQEKQGDHAISLKV